ncbi:MAG: hypothetical protein QOF89_5393 [Acidobacteriota bacterium]|jgi:hypothetical protein|nr:hypothetical protein [Acidobacteriota bacterium]
MSEHSDYIVYVDESGDHGLLSIDPQYPVFVLAFCIFHKEEYRLTASPALQDLKFRNFGHDMVIFHEREIRKATGLFSFLVDTGRREQFMQDLNGLIESIPVTLIGSVIQKERLRARYACPPNPYHIALAFGLERVASFLKARGQKDRPTHFVFECRGKNEDRELAEEFDRVCAGANYRGERLPFQMTLADKKTNCCGLQLADLFARPIGRRAMSPSEPNRAFDILRSKFYSNGGRVQGFGLKVFP